MADSYSYLKDPDKMLTYADAVYAQHQTRHTRGLEVRNRVRQRKREELKQLESQHIPAAQSSRGLAIVHQARSFVDEANLKYMVLPLDNSLKEDTATSNLERWLDGLKGTWQERDLHPFSDFLWDYFEVGTGIFRLTFDDTQAAEGEFPFLLLPIDPLQCGWIRSSRGLVFVVERELKEAAALCDELDNMYARAGKDKAWKLPDDLVEWGKSEPTRTIELTRCYDREMETMFYRGLASSGDSAGGGRLMIWQKPHNMGREPHIMARCIPTHTDLPEEEGFGIVYPILSMLSQENILFSKAAVDATIEARPTARYQGNDGRYLVEQTYPGYESEKGARDFQVMDVHSNYDMVDRLMNVAQQDIQRMTLPEVAYSGNILAMSGEAYRQALSGLAAKIQQFTGQPKAAFARAAGFILERVEYFMTPEMARQLAPGAQAYMESCSVALMVDTARGKQKGLMSLTAKDVKGHYRVRVDMDPSLPQDDTAKVQRFQGVVQTGYPWEQALRDYLQPEHPDEVIEARYDEMLMAENPDYKAFKLEQILKQKLMRDPKEFEAFMEWGMQRIMLMQQQQMMGDVGMPQDQGAMMQGQAQMPPGMEQMGMAQPPPQLGPGQYPSAITSGAPEAPMPPTQ